MPPSSKMTRTQWAPEVAKGISLPQDDFHPHWFSSQWPQALKHLVSLVVYPLSHPCPPESESKNQNAPEVRRRVRQHAYLGSRRIH